MRSPEGQEGYIMWLEKPRIGLVGFRGSRRQHELAKEIIKSLVALGTILGLLWLAFYL